VTHDDHGRSRPPRPPAPRPERHGPIPTRESPPAAPRREAPPPPPRPERPAATAPAGLAASPPPLPELTGAPAESLLDLVDSLLNKGAVVSGDLVLGLAGIDLVYLKLSALLAAADRVTGGGGRERGRRPHPAPGAPRGRLEDADGSRAPDPSRETARVSVVPVGDVPRPAGPGSRVAPGDPVTDRPEEADPTGGPVSPPAAPSSAEPFPPPDSPSPSTPARPGVAEAEREIDELRAEVERGLPADRPPRWNADPEEVERSVAKLVLTLVELVRQLLERQALRRMEEGTLSEEEVETLGRALMRLEETVHAIAGRFDIPPEELNLDLGPLGRLL